MGSRSVEEEHRSDPTNQLQPYLTHGRGNIGSTKERSIRVVLLPISYGGNRSGKNSKGSHSHSQLNFSLYLMLMQFARTRETWRRIKQNREIASQELYPTLKHVCHLLLIIPQAAWTHKDQSSQWRSVRRLTVLVIAHFNKGPVMQARYFAVDATYEMWHLLLKLNLISRITRQ